MEDTLGLGPQTNIEAVNLPAPEAELPDTRGADVAPVQAAPAQSLPNTQQADQALPLPTQSAGSVDPVPARPGDPNQAPIVPQAQGREWRKGAMDPRHVFKLFETEAERQGLVGLVPADGAKYGIRTGSAREWATFLTGLAAHESGLKNETVGDVSQFRGGSRGLLQLSYDDARNYGLNGGNPFTPEQLADPAQNAAAGVAIIKKLVGDAGSIRGGAGKYWGPISRENWFPGGGRDRDLPWSELGGPPLMQATGAVVPHVDTAPAFAPVGSKAASITSQIEAFRPAPGFWQAYEAAADESTSATLFSHSAMFRFSADAAYRPTLDELEQRKQGLPEKYWDRLIGVSAAHSDYLTEQARRQFANEVTLGEAGWSGVGAGLVSSLVDPIDFSVGVASGSLGAFAGGAMKAGRVAERLAAAGGAAAGNLALTGANDLAGKAVEGSDYAYAAAWGLGLGFAFGPLAKNPATRDIADKGAAAMGRAMNELSQPAQAGNLSSAISTQSTLQFSQGALARVGQDDASRTAIAQLRPDMAGRAGASRNPAIRMLGQLFGLDVVGRVGPNGERVVNPQSIGEMAAMIRTGWQDRVYSTVYPQFDEWAQARNFRFWERTKGIGRAWQEFADEVYAYRQDPRPNRDAFYSPQAARVDRVLTEAYADHLRGHADPRFDTPNNPGRPLAGMNGVPADPQYQPRKWRVDKIADADPSGRRFIEWVEGALLSSHPQLGNQAFTIADGMFRNLVGREFNIDEFQMIARNGATADVLRSYMQQLGIAQTDIDDILSRLPQGTRPDFAHFKLDLDEHWVHPQSGARMADFVETNAFELFDHYNHQSSAWRALGRAQVVDGQGNRIVDGIRSVNEFEGLLNEARSRGFDAGQTPEEIAKDAALAQEMFDRVRGVPHALTGGTVDQLLELARNAATTIFGGSFGLSALADAGRLASLGGVRAMLQHMPSFRMDIVNGGALQPRSGLVRDLQAVFAFADEFRPFSMRRAPADDSMDTIGNSFLRGVVGGSRVAAESVLKMSGMPAINRRLKAAASGVMAQRFFDDARRAMTANGIDLTRLRGAELERMKWFGMDDAMLTRILSQMQQHATSRQGILGEAITGFNPGNWTDQEALNAFANAVHRGAGRVVMEQDFGAGTVWDRSPVFKNFIQLRRFALNAWHMNILHGVAMRDGEAFADVLYSTFAAATLYAVRTRMQAATAEDPEKFIAERMAPGAFAAATFQLGAYSSLIPTLVDTFGANAIGANPIFGFRNSGLPSSALWGNPTFAMTDALAQAPGALFRPLITGRERSQQEWKQLVAPVPFQNNFLVQQALGQMIQDAPVRPPRNGGYSVADLIMGSTD